MRRYECYATASGCYFGTSCTSSSQCISSNSTCAGARPGSTFYCPFDRPSSGGPPSSPPSGGGDFGPATPSLACAMGIVADGFQSRATGGAVKLSDSTCELCIDTCPTSGSETYLIKGVHVLEKGPASQLREAHAFSSRLPSFLLCLASLLIMHRSHRRNCVVPAYGE